MSLSVSGFGLEDFAVGVAAFEGDGDVEVLVEGPFSSLDLLRTAREYIIQHFWKDLNWVFLIQLKRVETAGIHAAEVLVSLNQPYLLN